jgi:hypothetical protein
MPREGGWREGGEGGLEREGGRRGRREEDEEGGSTLANDATFPPIRIKGRGRRGGRGGEGEGAGG